MTKTTYTTTRVEMFNAVIDIVNASENPNKAELVERLNHEIELISKKSTSKVNAEKAKINESLTELIKNTLADGKARTVSEIQMTCPELSLANGISNSKVTSLLGAMVKAGIAVRAMDKKKSYYSLA